eukprot:3712505-Amphidinium_carterae.1
MHSIGWPWRLTSGLNGTVTQGKVLRSHIYFIVFVHMDTFLFPIIFAFSLDVTSGDLLCFECFLGFHESAFGCGSDQLLFVGFPTGHV